MTTTLTLQRRRDGRARLPTTRDGNHDRLGRLGSVARVTPQWQDCQSCQDGRPCNDSQLAGLVLDSGLSLQNVKEIGAEKGARGNMRHDNDHDDDHDNETTWERRTDRAEVAIRRAKETFYAMADDPDLCIRKYLPVVLAFVSADKRAACERMFRENILDQQFRLEFALWAYRGALDLYRAGELD